MLKQVEKISAIAITGAFKTASTSEAIAEAAVDP